MADKIHLSSDGGRITVGANDVIIIDSSNNVGIGTSPSKLFHIKNPSSGGNTISFQESNLSTDQAVWMSHGKELNTNNCSAIGFKYMADQSSNNLLQLGFFNGGDKLNIRADGFVGVGTTTPFCPLHVAGAGQTTTAWGLLRQFIHDPDLHPSSATDTFQSPYNQNWTNQNFGLYVEYRSASSGYYIFSDSRIKKDIVEIDDSSSLEILRLLNVKNYKYKDLEKGDYLVSGFLAQEVETVLPHAVVKGEESIPNIYEFATVTDSNVVNFTNFDTGNIDSNSTILCLKDRNYKSFNVNITNIINSKSIQIDTNIDDKCYDIDSEGNIIDGNLIFVYGQTVTDFCTLKKDAIWTTGISALQEVDRQLQAEKVKTAALETQAASQQATIDAQQATIDTLTTNYNSLLERISALENA